MRRLFLAAALVAVCLAFSRPARAQDETLSGWLTYLWSDQADGTPGPLEIFLRSDDGALYQLRPAPGAELPYPRVRALAGRRVRVTGTIAAARAEGAATEVVFSRVEEDAAAGRPALTTGALVSGPQPYVTILCRPSDRVTAPVRAPQYFTGLVTGSNQYEMDHYWREQSYGHMTLDGSTVIGWLDLPQPEAYYFPNVQVHWQRLLTDCTAAADAQIDFRAFAGINLVVNAGAGSSAYGGTWLETLDGLQKVWRTTWMPSWATYPAVWGHELGHSLGFPHSGPSSKWDVMGASVGPNSAYGASGQHTIAVNKDSVGWFSGRVVQVNPGESASVTLERLAKPATGGVQMIKIPTTPGGSRFLTVEARQRTGYDSGLVGDGVIIHDIQLGREPQVVESDANGNVNDGTGIWIPGETYVDTSGVRISVLSAAGSGYVVTVAHPGTAPLVGFGTLAGSPGVKGLADGSGSAARFDFLSALAVDEAGNVYVADELNNRVRRVTPAGVVSTLPSPPGSCQFCMPTGLALDSAGNLYVLSYSPGTIRKVAPDGTITVLAGSTTASGSQDGAGPAARFAQPRGLAIDGAGTLYVADTGNNSIRRVTPDGQVTTLAGAAGTQGFTNGTGTEARFRFPTSIAVGADGAVYVADRNNFAIRRITTAGVVTTLAGSGSSAHGDAVGTAASFTSPLGIAATPNGALVVGDYYTIRSVHLDGRVGTLAGAPFEHGHRDGFGDGVRFLMVSDLAVARNGTIYAADRANHVVRASYDSNLLALRPGVLNFGATKAGAAGAIVNVTPDQSLLVTPPAGAAWTASVDQPWVRLSRGSGTGTGTIAIGIVNDGNVLGGSALVTANVRVTVPAQNLARSLLVRLAIQDVPDTSAAPTGAVDTPVQNATGLSGSIGVTGWAMDDVAVVAVKIYRNCLSGIDVPQNCQAVAGQPAVYIGDAAFLAGARPDVEALFPDHPQAYRAGWGYLMLTNMLPHIPLGRAGSGGQGTFTLSAVAIDAEGRQTLLGTRTITLDNDHATRPFGAIDTPVQGGTVSGTLANFGWALTPGTAMIPANGSTMVVFLDGQPVSTVAYNQCRGTVGNPAPAGTCNDDIATLFPGYTNITQGGGAIGAHVIDTTKLANGLHTIAWSVTDSAGRTEGIGSRFFNVLNATSDTIAAAQEIQARTPVIHGRAAPAGGPGREPADFDTAQSGKAGLYPVPSYRTGFDLSAPFVELTASRSGVYDVALPQGGRLEIDVPGATSGYLRVGRDLRDLPAGASLDPRTGRLAWIPPTGYVGTYDLVLHADGPVTVRVTIAPR